jgi:hypothetical protein
MFYSLPESMVHLAQENLPRSKRSFCTLISKVKGYFENLDWYELFDIFASVLEIICFSLLDD